MKIKIFESVRSILYMPMYALYKMDYKPIFDTTDGDHEAIKNLSGHNEDDEDKNIALGLCDPMAITTMREKNVKVISNLINKAAIWFIGLKYDIDKIKIALGNASSRQEQSKLDALLNQAKIHNNKLDKISNSPRNNPSLFNNTNIFYREKSLSTETYFIEKLGAVPKNYKIKKKAINEFELVDEVRELLNGNIVLSNVPWILTEILEKNEDFREEREYFEESVSILADFGSNYSSFTAICTNQKTIDNHRDKLGKILEDIQNIIYEIYANPYDFSHSMLSILKANKFDLGTPYEDDLTTESIFKPLSQYANERIYNPHLLTTFTEWKRANKTYKNINEKEVRQSYEDLVERIQNIEIVRKSMLLPDH